MEDVTAEQREEVQAILHGREPGEEVTADLVSFAGGVDWCVKLP
jgi:hypothetical protein